MKYRYPRKAFILAAGYGTRMRPLTEDVPKPLMPFWGRPVLEHAIRMLADWGVREILINCHHQADQIMRWIQTHPVPGVHLNLSYEPEILGTGGPLRRAAWFLDEPFWLFNADVVAEVNPQPLVKQFYDRNALAMLWMHEQYGPRTVEVKSGKIVNFIATAPGTPGTYTFCGLHLLRPDITKYLLPANFSSIISAYQAAMAAGRYVGGATVKHAYWSDLGTPEQYLAAHGQVAARGADSRLLPRSARKQIGRLKKQGVHIKGFAYADASVRMGKEITLEDTVIWPGARIATRSMLKQAIVGRNTRVQGTADHVLVPATLMLSAGEAERLERQGWDAARTTAQVLPARGSDRTFTRLRQARAKAILVRYGTERPENDHYARLARFLDGLGLRVPGLLDHDGAGRWLLMEDLGTVSLLDKAGTASSAQLMSWYRKVLDQLIIFQQKGTAAAGRQSIPLQPAFTRKLYRWEHALFLNRYAAVHTDLPAERRAALAGELRRVSRRLEKAPPVLVHRDLQSTNILWVRHQPAFIDFQGMRLGPAAYDLASLLADPYVGLPQRTQEQLLAYYLQAGGAACAVNVFPYACVQRLCQALGAYGRMGRLPGTRRFLNYIPPALRMLRLSLRGLDDLPNFKEWLSAS